MGVCWRRQKRARLSEPKQLGVVALAGLALGIVFLVAGTEADAYESYHDPNYDDVGYCTGCHPGFTDGKSDTLHKLHTGGDSPLGVLTKNCTLCHTGDGKDNPMMLWSTGDADDGLGCAGCHGRDYGETIGEDYRGFPIRGLSKATAYGLREHHATLQIRTCARCHNAAPQGVLAENVAPPYYLRDDVNIKNPCADLLDNDGDGFYDSDDTDCAGNLPPIADPNGPYEETVGASVDFDGSGSFDADGSIAAYEWNFGDGTTGTGETTRHSYEDAGTYTVSLRVTDDGGLTDSATTTAIITDGPPVADPDGPYRGTVGVAITFDGSASYDTDGSIEAYAWDFGDSSSGFGVTPTHAYTAAGTYTVELMVTDDSGLTDTATTTATITLVPNAPPVATADDYSTPQDVVLSVPAPGVLGNDSDSDGDPLTAELQSGVSNGELWLSPSGAFTYTPAAGFVGTDTFTYVADDGVEHSNVATVTIDVHVPGVVLAADDSYATFPDTILTVPAPGVLSNDAGGSARWAFKRSEPSHGSVDLEYDGSFVYTPNPGFAGSDSFTYNYWDGDAGRYSNYATVNLQVWAVDLDIVDFEASRRADLDRFRGITLTLEVVNNGTVDIPDALFGATATIVGTQGAEVFRTTLPMWDPVADDTTVFEISIDDPALFSPGVVVWTATLDVPYDEDVDVATSSTEIRE